jgi:transposase, IS605 OrfB family, central region
MSRRKGGENMESAVTVKVKLKPDREQTGQLMAVSKGYIATINSLVSWMVSEGRSLKLSSRDVVAELPSAVRNHAIRDAKSVYRKSKRQKRVSILKKPVCIWNNQNYSIKDNVIEMPVMINNKSERIAVRAIITDYQNKILNGENIKPGALRISQKSGKWIAQICVGLNRNKEESEDGKTKFFGNGRQNKYIKRKFRAKRRKLGKAKKVKTIRKMQDKEQRWMKDQDHKISRAIVDFAEKNNVSEIRLEKLTNIRNTARTSRKNEKNLHTWSFYRLAQFIEYKANLLGIKVEHVDPKYTSQSCPKCGTLNKARDRKYRCKCGMKIHRDRLGAINIISAPVADGNSLSA